MSRTVAVALAEALKRHGVTEIFGQSLPSALFLATPAVGIRQITYRTENAGGVMADGYARTSGRIGVVAAQNGPAATLLVPPMAEATKSSVPLLALVQDVPTSSRDRNAFQEYDHQALFASCAKWIRSIDDPTRVDEYVDMAMTVACSGRPGPVVLMLPADILNQPAPDAPTRSTALGTFPLDRTVAAPESIERAATAIANARRPILIAGGGVHLSGAAEVIAALQEHASLPVGTTTMGKGSVDETHPLSIGIVSNYMGTTSAAHDLRDFVREADVVVFVGSRTNENGTDSWKAFSRDATVVHVDVDSAEIGRNYPVDIRLAGDALLTCRALLAALEKTELSVRRAARPGFERTIAEARTAHRARVDDMLTSDVSPVRPERVVSELDAVLADRHAIVTTDASYSTIWMGNYMRARRPGQRFITPRGLAGLGWGLPFALGAKTANPDSVVVSVVGDGGLGHVWSEFETAARERLAVVVVLLDNQILGFQKHAELVRFGAHTTAVDLALVDHAAIARAAGADAVRVESTADLRPALEKAITSGTPWLVEVRCEADARPPITAWDSARN